MWDANPDVLVTDLGDELVLMHPATGLMFGLGASGREVWRALPGSAEDLAHALARAYALPLETARHDVGTLLRDLKERNLLQEVGGSD